MMSCLNQRTVVFVLPLLFGRSCWGWGTLPTTAPSLYGIRINHVNQKTTAGRSSWSTVVLSAKPNPDDVVDVDFERVKSTEGAEEVGPTDRAAAYRDSFPQKKTLFDLSLDSGDPKWKETRVPFLRSTTDEYIDGKLAFTVELEGIQYGIAIPFDDAVAIVIETKSTGGEHDVKYVDPEKYEENEDYQELMEVMAAQVQEQLGEEYQLRKTPKVLTISGGLDKITKDWERKVMPDGPPFSAKDLLEDMAKDDEDEMIKEFYQFMKDELGEEEFQKTMNEEMSDEDREFLKFFDVPGLGTQKDDLEGIEELLNSIPEDLEKGVAQGGSQFNVMDTEGMALKLISFDFKGGGKAYSLVKLLQPYVLVGKYSPGPTAEDALQFELLSPTEEKVLIPRLENLCREDLKEKGLSFKKTP